jgi:hypothetical protein
VIISTFRVVPFVDCSATGFDPDCLLRHQVIRQHLVLRPLRLKKRRRPGMFHRDAQAMVAFSLPEIRIETANHKLPSVRLVQNPVVALNNSRLFAIRCHRQVPGSDADAKARLPIAHAGEAEGGVDVIRPPPPIHQPPRKPHLGPVIAFPRPA